MTRNYSRTKKRMIIKAFLCANKGKAYTGKELANFINCNYFGMDRTSTNPLEIARIIKSAKSDSADRLFDNVILEKKNTLWTYMVME